MTGYARASSGPFVVEVQTLNRRHLDIRCHLSAPLRSMEMVVRKEIGKWIHRGAVSVSVIAEQELNWAYLERAAELADEMAEKLEIDRTSAFKLALQGQPLMMAKTDEKALAKAIATAMGPLVKMREEEGAMIKEQLSGHLKAIGPIVDGLAKRAKKRLVEVDEETAIKIDVTEELHRLRHHLDGVEALFDVKEPVGKKLEFTVQELMREANTIGAKTGDGKSVELKCEIEKIREQIQNVE